jgi:hypothetical protein
MIYEISRREDVIQEYEENVSLGEYLVVKSTDCASSRLGIELHSWIDPDYGWVISAQDFLVQTERDHNWDWRRPDPRGDK